MFKAGLLSASPPTPRPGNRVLTSTHRSQGTIPGSRVVYILEGLMLKLKLQYLGHLMQRADLCWKKTLMLERSKTKGEGDDRG